MSATVALHLFSRRVNLAGMSMKTCRAQPLEGRARSPLCAAAADPTDRSQGARLEGCLLFKPGSGPASIRANQRDLRVRPVSGSDSCSLVSICGWPHMKFTKRTQFYFEATTFQHSTYAKSTQKRRPLEKPDKWSNFAGNAANLLQTPLIFAEFRAFHRQEIVGRSIDRRATGMRGRHRVRQKISLKSGLFPATIPVRFCE